MALVIKDRVKETTTTTGTGTYTLAGAVSGFETFTANLSNSDTTYYVCTDNTDFEVGLGTFTSSGTTLARTTILASSNSNNAVNWSSGTRSVFMTYPADKAVFEDASNNINGTFVGNITGNVTGNADTATVATTVTITDNESTSEDNAVVFTAGGDVDGGNIGLESDGDLTYNPSTGRLTATQLAGTLQTAAQTNITSVGTLSSLATSGDITVGDDLFVSGGLIDLKNDGAFVSQIKFYCESSNAHAQTLIGAPHAQSATNTLTLPDGSNGTLLSTVSTATVTNKTLTSPKINEDVALTSTATELNLLDGITGIADEDDLTSDSNTKLATQQSIKAYVDAQKADMQFVLEDGDGTEVQITKDKEVKFVEGGGLDINWTDVSTGSDADPYDLTFTVNAAQTGIESVVNTSLEIGRDADNRIKFGTDNQIIFEVSGGDNVIFKASGEIEATSLDIGSGGADIDGTLEANAITIGGTTLAEVISDTTGAMFSSNTETGITVTYQDADNTIDVVIDAAQTTITSLLATDIKIGEDDQTKIDFETANTINFYAGNEKQLILTDGALTPGANNILDLGSSSVEFKDAFFDGTVTSDAFAGPLTGNVTGNADTATALATGRTIGMTGDVVWTSASFTGAGNVTGSATIQAGAVENSMLADDAVGADELAANAVVNASVASGAAIAFSKMADLTASRALVSDGSGDVSVSAVTSTEVGYLDGVTSAIQTQIDAKASKGFATAMAIAL